MPRLLQYLIPGGCFLLVNLPIVFQEAGAAFNRSLDYSLETQVNSDDTDNGDNGDNSDRTFSTLTLSMDDSFYHSRFRGTYDLESNFFAEHNDNETNDQHEGNFNSEYVFIDSGFWWNFDAAVGVLPADTSVNIDEFDSQTITTVSTGPELSIRQGFRGSIDIAVQAAKVAYSDTDLDSTEYGSSVTYNYPFDASTAGGVEVAYRSVEYDDNFNSVNDYDISRLKLFYGALGEAVQYNLEGSVNTISSDSDPDDQYTFAINAAYQVNSSSSLSLELSDTLQSSEVFNSLPGNLANSEFQSGLLKNKRAALGYDYSYRNLSAGLLFYANRFDNVVATVSEDEDLDGWFVYFSNQFNPKFRFDASYDHSKTTTTDVEQDDFEASLTYTEQHTRKLTSNFILAAEVSNTDDPDGSDFDNMRFTYQFVANIFQ